KNLGNGSSLSATYSYLDDQGFLPDLDEKRGGGSSNYQKKHNFGIGGQTKLDNGITLKGNFNFVNSEIRKPLTNPAFGGAGDGLFAAVLFTPRSIDMMNLEYENPLDGSNVYYRTDGGIEHPLWNLNNKADLENVQRFFSNVELGYEFTDWLKFQYRISLDSYSQFNERKVNRGSGRSDNDGYYNTIIAKSNWTDHVANLLYDKRFEKFSFNGIVGVNYRVRKFERSYLYSSNQLVYNIFAHDKFVSQTGASEIEDVYTLGVYATATVGYSDFLYLTVQGRNDWTSTLESANRSILYPSASLSFLPFEAIPGLRDNGVVDYAKFRVSYGTSAGYPDPYRTRSVLGAATNQFIGPDGTQLNTNSVSSRLGNADLAPELHSELEFGTEAQFFNGRVGLDLSLYSKTSKDLIIDLPLDPATGYTVTTVNGAEVSNKGIELGMNFTPIKTSSGFEWNMNLNYTKNVSKVESIISGVDQVIIAGYTTLGNVARPGEAYGAMLGTDFNRYETGELLVNAQGSYTVNSENVIIGNPNPDFQANMSNTFTYKGFSFGFQWNYIHGGDIYSSTVGALMARGNTVDSDFNRFQPILLNGVLSDGTPNNIQTYAGDTFFDAYFGADKGSVFDATVLRLREISLAYALPKGVLSKTPFGSASITLAGENLFYTAPNFPKGMNYDPEVLSLGVGNGRGFDFRTAPTAKRYGVTLNVTF
ncbi:MAG: SusC/RagA family TonB-linked outer membrane protein, partial [Thalassobius sp.]|nr:SusC/RagA family TonB-linked outer membrane protein [Thalassovita sp.]